MSEYIIRMPKNVTRLCPNCGEYFKTDKSTYRHPGCKMNREMRDLPSSDERERTRKKQEAYK